MGEVTGKISRVKRVPDSVPIIGSLSRTTGITVKRPISSLVSSSPRQVTMLRTINLDNMSGLEDSGRKDGAQGAYRDRLIVLNYENVMGVTFQLFYLDRPSLRILNMLPYNCFCRSEKRKDLSPDDFKHVIKLSS